MTLFPTVTGPMFGRSNKWAKTAERLRDAIDKLTIDKPTMNPSTHQIEAAVNAAEPLIDHTAGRGKRVEIYQHELTVLIAAANECVQRRLEEEPKVPCND